LIDALDLDDIKILHKKCCATSQERTSNQQEKAVLAREVVQACKKPFDLLRTREIKVKSVLKALVDEACRNMSSEGYSETQRQQIEQERKGFSAPKLQLELLNNWKYQVLMFCNSAYVKLISTMTP